MPARCSELPIKSPKIISLGWDSRGRGHLVLLPSWKIDCIRNVFKKKKNGGARSSDSAWVSGARFKRHVLDN